MKDSPEDGPRGGEHCGAGTSSGQRAQVVRRRDCSRRAAFLRPSPNWAITAGSVPEPEPRDTRESYLKIPASGPRASVVKFGPAVSTEMVHRRTARGEPHLPTKHDKAIGARSPF